MACYSPAPYADNDMYRPYRNADVQNNVNYLRGGHLANNSPIMNRSYNEPMLVNDLSKLNVHSDTNSSGSGAGTPPQENSYSPGAWGTPVQQHRQRQQFVNIANAHHYGHSQLPPRAGGYMQAGTVLNLNMTVESMDGSIVSSTNDNSQPGFPRAGTLARTTIPPSLIDKDGTPTCSLAEILSQDLLLVFARDKMGQEYLVKMYPGEDDEDRHLLVDALFNRKYDDLPGSENLGIFSILCRDVFGNFFVQEVIKRSVGQEQNEIKIRLEKSMFEFCRDRYACRVVQEAFETLPKKLTEKLLLKLRGTDLVELAVNQNANHVIQKVMTIFPVSKWSFIIDAFIKNDENLFAVAENKYGCRVMQLSIERLAAPFARLEYNAAVHAQAQQLLERVMSCVLTHCEQLSSNEFANYVIQNVISTDSLGKYRQQIIEKCLLRSLLSLSQEKYASHVVEKALKHAPHDLQKDMMDEIFDGYIPHPETKKDALDILMFHQYGNYVVQKMLDIVCQAEKARRTDIHVPDMAIRMEWFKKMESKIRSNETRLSKYSSGNKILKMLQDVRAAPLSVPQRRRQSTRRGSSSAQQRQSVPFNQNTAAYGVPAGYQ